ncbi:MAG: serine protease [Bacteroidetes bacterium]|nr:serine protease [Bacteroidota bacterium]
MRTNRLDAYKEIERLRNSKLLVYVTGDRQNAETNIGADIIAPFANHLDIIGGVEKISLLIYSNGGSTLAGWNLVNLIRSFCNDFEVIIPFRCQSAATLISLGANRIIMTKQATLGPIDPSTNGLMNPQVNINGQNIRVPVSVEHVNGYLDMAKEDANLKDVDLKEVFLKLADNIHPLSLGDVYKAKSQIKMLAEKLLKYHTIEVTNVPKVISFLCSESGSHDYTINRKEAKDELGLNVEVPSEELYKNIKEIYQDIENELELRNPFNANVLLATVNTLPYTMRRALIESVEGGTDVFVSEGTISKINIAPGKTGIQDSRTFESWRHEN